MHKVFFTIALVAICCSVALAAEPLSLIDVDKPNGGWDFGDGPEFPGAKGSLGVKEEKFRDRPVLALSGDFTGGGNYVQAAIKMPDVPVQTLSFWLKAPAGAGNVTVRLVDGSDQCHQLRLKMNDRGEWQQIVLPVEEFFRNMGTAAALDVTSQYERWGGAADGRWHQPGRLLVILNSRNLGLKSEILFSDVRLQPGRPKTSIAKTISLAEFLADGEIDWEFNQGWEFPGAKGSLELVRNEPAQGDNSMRFSGDFTGGGAYVGMRKSLARLDVKAIKVIRLKMRSQSTRQFNLRLVDGTGQCHQRKGIPFEADGRWHDVEIVPAKIAGGEHWGGANDGQWHDSVQLMELMLNDSSGEKKVSDLLIAQILADVEIDATPAAAAFSEDFDAGEPLKDRWQVAGDVGLAEPGAESTARSLLLKRTVDTIETPTSATSRPFAVQPGAWQVGYAWKADLRSPDNSYHGAVDLEVFDSAGKRLEAIPIDVGFGRRDWQTVSKTVVLPGAATRAQFRVELRKTYGSFQVDQLTAARLTVQPIQQRVERILVDGSALGNLFLPGAKVAFDVTVEAARPLPEAQQTLRWCVRDYWGARQIQPAEVPLARQEGKGKPFRYKAAIELKPGALEVGKYYELHVAVPQPPAEPVTEYAGLAILPEAASKQYPPEQIPFTIRNWDSRIREYFLLADRIGLRMLGVWGGWSDKPPYKPHCPGADTCQKLGAKWITGTPAAEVERHGFEKITEECLRDGMKNFLEAYADKGLAMIALGNEPHGTGQKVLDNVRAYRAVYESVKAFDPKIQVLGTSVEPNEEYFKAGYQNYLDAYDFHIYEHYTDVRRTMREYRALMDKYHAVKPIHSTELGLNSQGQTRLAVSRELIKKFVSFFAEGGATVSWFTIQYPDPKGKARGSFGDSHCVFDCKYNLYNPRLDAVTHYQVLNALCVKKFVEEKHYADDAQAYLFRDTEGRCLQALWLDGQRKEVSLPLGPACPVAMIRIDGARRDLTASPDGLTLTLSDDPVLLLYEDKDAKLPDALGKPALRLAAEPKPVAPGGSTEFTLIGPKADPESIRVECPPLWKASVERTDNGARVTIDAPAATTARVARIYVQILNDSAATGEIRVPVAVAHPSR